MKMQKFKELPFITRLAIGSGSSLLFGLFFGYLLFPVILKHQIKKEMSLRNKTDMKEMWVKLPFPIEFKVWVWNVTNPDEAHRGEKPIVQEVGPYVYEKWIEKIDLVENKEEDSIEYTRKDTYIFKPELSGGLTGEESIYTPHILIVGTSNYIATEKPSMLKLASKAIDGVYNSPKSVFILHKVREVLFDGVKVYCNTTDFAPKAICTAYKSVESLREHAPGVFKYSFFGNANGTDPKRIKVLRGIKNITDVGKVIEHGGKKSQDIWKGEHCDNFTGTDGTIFRPFVTKKDELWTFSPEICRSLGTYYEGKSSYRGIKGYRFVADFGDLPNEPENQCFCSDPATCPARGLMYINKCIPGPLVISLPHFHKVDPAIQSSVIGIHPDKEKHGIFLDFEPISGTPLYAKKRIQLNCKVINIPQMEMFAHLQNTYVPVIWLEEGLALNKTYIRMLNFQLFYPMKAVSLIKWGMILGGLGGSIYAAILYRTGMVSRFDRSNNVNAITPAADEMRSSANSAESQNNNGITPLDKDIITNSNPALPGKTTRY